MFINLIVANTGDNCYDIVAAWDEWILDANYAGFEKDRAKWEAKHDIRIIEIEVPDDMYEKAFARGPRIKAAVREGSGPEKLA